LQNRQILKGYQSSVDEIPGIRPKKDFMETGAGFIYSTDSIQVAFIRMYNPADTLGRGDMISLQMQVPQLPYRGVFSELAFNGIIFTDAEKNPLYTLDYLFHHDSRKLEDSLFGVIIKSLHSTYELVKDRPELPASLLAKVTAGRFKNRIPLEIIRDVTRKDLEAFFMYTQAYPVGYMGKNYRASESFAGWLISNSPYSVGEVKQGLFPVYKNPVEFKKRLSEYKTDVLNEHTATSLATDAIGLSNQLKFTEAQQLSDFSIALAEGVNDTMSKPTVYLCKAQLFLDQEKYPESVTWCDKAIKAALLAGDRDIEIQAIIKKGYCYYKLSKYQGTETMMSNAVDKLNQHRATLGEKVYNNNYRKILEYRSSIRNNAGRYDEALQLLDSAIRINNRINSYDAQLANAGYYAFIGRVYNDQGKPADAVPALKQSVTIYRNNSDVLNSAIVENDLAYSYYKQGNYRQSMEQAGMALNKLVRLDDFNNAGYSMSLTGSCYWQMGLYDSALSAHHASLALREKSGNLSGQAYSWTRLGDLYKESGSKKQSLLAYEKAADLYRKMMDSTGLAEVFNARGQVYLDDENFKNAASEFEKANGVSHKSTVEALYKLGIAWSSIDTVKARKYFQEARRNSIDDGNTGYQFASSRLLARMAYLNQDKRLGERYYNECVALGKEIKTAFADAQCLSLTAYKFECETQLDSALFYYRKAMTITDTVDRGVSVGHLNSIASIFISMGEFRKAEDALNSAIRVARDISDSLSLGSTLQFSSFLYSRTAEFARGLANNDSAIAIFKNSGHLIRLAGTYASRATLYSSMGENKESILANLYADSLYNEEMQKEQQGLLYNNIGIVYISQGDYPTAMKYLLKSLTMLPKVTNNEDYLLVQGNMAECYIGLKKYKEARTLLMEFLPLTRKMKLNRIASGMALVFGKLSLQENKIADATRYYTEAWLFGEASGEKEKALEALINLGRIYRKEGNKDTAAARIREAVALSVKYKLAGGWEAFYESGLFSYEAKQYDTAVVYFKEAVGLLETLTDKLFGGEAAKKIFNNDPRKADLFNKITFSYYNLGDINQAWSYANRSNIAGIRELSGSLTTNSSDAEKNEALKKLFSLQESKKALEGTLEKQEGVARQETLKKIEILEADYNNFLSDVVELYPDLGTYFSKSNADEFNKYKSKLPADVAVALYLLNDKTLMIFTLTNEKLAVDTMTVDLAPRISRFIEAIKNTGKQTGTGPLSLRSDPVDEDKTARHGGLHRSLR
jgi:tetratricopeptide (TPR) repeat protein